MLSFNITRFALTEAVWTYPDMQTAKAVLGGKGAGLLRMCCDGLPVPPGFTIPTKVCNEFRSLDTEEQRATFMTDLMDEVEEYMGWLEARFGHRPLVSVRSGAPVSMPGMMDTILNVGLTEADLGAWEDRLGCLAALDCQRRLIQMLGATAFGVAPEVFEQQLTELKVKAKVDSDGGLDVIWRKQLVKRYLAVFEHHKGFDFPVDDAKAQLRAAIRAVFDSWMNDRAVEYRRLNGIPDDMGTAVNVQAMVFGNMGADSGSGVLFTRNPSTGEPVIMGEYLENAQGEDVVAGVRTPAPLTNYMTPTADGYLASCSWAAQLVDLCAQLEQVYGDMVDIEFTVQRGELFLLQSRVGKRSARAAFRIADDLLRAGEISIGEALSRITVAQFKQVKRPVVDPTFKEPPTLMGIPACPGVAIGRAVFSKEAAVASSEPCILVTEETTPDDLAGMAKAQGILTKTGGATSHAAVVARAMDKPCIVGAGDLDLHAPDASVIGKDVAFDTSTIITIDGATGRVWIGVCVPVIDASTSPELASISSTVHRSLGTRPLTPRGELPDFTTGEAIFVSLRENWGDLVWFERILDMLDQVSYRQHITLDLRTPAAYDSAMIEIFGVAAEQETLLQVRELLAGRVASYTGCSVIWDGALGDMPSEVADALPLGGRYLPDAVPDDYAVFRALRA